MSKSLEKLCYQYSQECWKRHYLIQTKRELYPSETIVRLLSPYFDKNLTLIDIGGGTGKNSISLRKRFKNTIIVDPAVSSMRDSRSPDEKGIEVTTDFIAGEADLARLIRDDAVVLCSYTIDHMPKSLGLNILKMLTKHRRFYQALVISSFLDSSTDAMNIPILGCPNQYLRPFSKEYFNEIQKILCDKPVSMENIKKICSSGALAELHSFYSYRELAEVFTSMSPALHSYARIIRINEREGSLDPWDMQAFSSSLDILFVSL